MFNIKLAELIIGIDNKFEGIRLMCKDYICNETKCDFTVSASESEMLYEGDKSYGLDYLETLAIYRKIAENLAPYGGFLIHGVLLRVGGKGILFCADSGTGKSTHAALWQRLLGEKCEIINGDKPLVRIKDGVAYAYGTPWCGKENININSSVKLCEVCFISRAEENKTYPTPKENILKSLIPHIHIPSGEVLVAIDTAARQVNFKNIECNMDISAAETSYNAIFGRCENE